VREMHGIRLGQRERRYEYHCIMLRQKFTIIGIIEVVKTKALGLYRCSKGSMIPTAPRAHYPLCIWDFSFWLWHKARALFLKRNSISHRNMIVTQVIDGKKAPKRTVPTSPGGGKHVGH